MAEDTNMGATPGMISLIGYQLIEARDALKGEITNPYGMIVSRAVCARTIIPWLFKVGITEVVPPYNKHRKIKAWNDLNAFMVANGFPNKTLE